MSRQQTLSPTNQRSESLLNVVHGVNCGFGVGVLSVPDEAEPTASAGVAVLDNDLGWQNQWSAKTRNGTTHYSLFDLTIFLELGTERTIIGMPCKAAVNDEQRRQKWSSLSLFEKCGDVSLTQ